MTCSASKHQEGAADENLTEPRVENPCRSEPTHLASLHCKLLFRGEGEGEAGKSLLNPTTLVRRGLSRDIRRFDVRIRPESSVQRLS